MILIVNFCVFIVAIIFSQRDSWMEMPLDMMPLTSRQDVIDAKEKEKQEAQKAAEQLVCLVFGKI